VLNSVHQPLLIRQARLVDPQNHCDQLTDILIQDGKINRIGQDLPDPGQRIDAQGLIAIPGLVDLCHHLREPGQKHKGTIASETYAAVSGGVTSLCCPPDTKTVIDNSAVVKLIRVSAENDGFCRVYLTGAMTKGLQGEKISEMQNLMGAGCVAVSNALKPVEDNKVLRRLLEYAASHHIQVIIYPQDYSLSKNACAHDGKVSARLGLAGIPDCAETIALLSTMELLELTGARVHFGHISSAKGVEIIRQAKQRGLPITADVSINHLHLTEMDIGFFDSNCHVIPPFRTQHDRAALREGIRDGTLDAIVSDHQPHDEDAKLAPFAETEPGISGVETYFSLAMKMAAESGISLSQIVTKMTCGPAAILQLKAGQLAIGAEADICLFDPQDAWSVETGRLHSMGKNTPYAGWELAHRVHYTLVGGQIMFKLS